MSQAFIGGQLRRLRPHPALFFILFIFTALAIFQSITLPIGEADDETDHYQYLRFVAQTGHPPFTAAERNEAGFKGGLAPLYYWLTAWPIALIGQNSLPDVRRVDARPERHIPTDGLGINHVLHTLDEQWPWRGQVLAWHLIRFLSIPMGWITIIATYALACRLWPNFSIISLGAAAFVALLPRFVSSSAVINDDNLIFALTTLLLLTQVVILQNSRPSPRIFAIFGALFGLALITKYFSLILIPEVLFTLVIVQLSGSRAQKTEDRPFIPETSRNPHPGAKLEPAHWVPLGTFPIPYYLSGFRTLLPFLAAFTLTAGPWFTFVIWRFNRINELGLIAGLAASLGEPQVTEGLVGLLSGQAIRPPAATYNLPEWLGLLYRSFWFEYGWMQLFAPTWVYILFSIFLLLALSGCILQIRAKPSGMLHAWPVTSLLGLHLLLFVMVVLARYVLSATIDTGQGRHLYPALPVIAVIISFGLTRLGFRILDAGFQLFPALATNLLPILLRLLPGARHLPPAMGYFLPALFYLLPAAVCLFPSSFILPHYHTLPVTIIPPANLPITYRHTLSFADDLSLAGFDAATTVTAGEALPVTLYWRANQEAQQDYIVSLCLYPDSNNNQPAGCWRGHFANGRYPARAWEIGDTIRDTVFIPIPTCYHSSDQAYHLQLEVWPLALDSPEPALAGPPVLQQTFTEPLISIQAAHSLPKNSSQTVELWRGQKKLNGPSSMTLGESLTWLDYTTSTAGQSPRFISPAAGALHQWLPMQGLGTPLYLPCQDGPTPLAHVAHFLVGQTLPAGAYAADTVHIPPHLTLLLNVRHRILAPISSTLVFTPSLAPLWLEFPGQPPISFMETEKRGDLDEQPNLPLLHPSHAFLPITIRWQARRWMADPLIASLKLLDKDFQVGGERLATLGDRYPNVLWVPGEIVEETYPLRLNSQAPPGLYRLEISLLRQEKSLPDGYEYLPLAGGETPSGHNLYPVTFRLLDPADGSPPPHSLSAQLGEAIHLTGYELNPASRVLYPPSPISLALYWQSTAKISTDYTVFTQLVGPDGQIWAQWDNPPQAGRYPTTAWAASDKVVDRYRLTLRPNAPPGQYRLLVGMYNRATGLRIPATLNGQPQPDSAIELTTLTIDN